jgi:hypothetical protein
VKDLNNGIADFSAWPNPADDNTTVKYNLKGNKDATLVLRNVLGTTVSETKLPKATGEVELSTRNLGEGVYFYFIQEDEKITAVKKLIISR